MSESRTHTFRSQLPDDELPHTVITALYAGGRRTPPEEFVVPLEPSEAALLIELLDFDAGTEVVDCFDVSNLQGTHVVASRLRFRRGHADRAGTGASRSVTSRARTTSRRCRRPCGAR